MPTGFEVLSLLVLTLGVVLSIWEGSIAGSPTGICIAVASTFCGAAMLSFSGKVPSTCAPLQACQSVRRNMPLDIHHWPLHCCSVHSLHAEPLWQCELFRTNALKCPN